MNRRRIFEVGLRDWINNLTNNKMMKKTKIKLMR